MALEKPKTAHEPASDMGKNGWARILSIAAIIAFGAMATVGCKKKEPKVKSVASEMSRRPITPETDPCEVVKVAPNETSSKTYMKELPMFAYWFCVDVTNGCKATTLDTIAIQRYGKSDFDPEGGATLDGYFEIQTGKVTRIASESVDCWDNYSSCTLELHALDTKITSIMLSPYKKGQLCIGVYGSPKDPKSGKAPVGFEVNILTTIPTRRIIGLPAQGPLVVLPVIK